ncbi:hypothetical protein PHYSODRAFT_336798 [Phytophthora sojae]|uniref:Uncharacterized protein n=1 Tax=Phytophthora sojae (strain P6497) TaxID=1094619 RepID=G4ZWE5_PHYSP|nr:hypothetical protein PHYSODRAFT_336798 [Phytophthora sojae]EGZ12373.1 hypothetical protein PHYSODRAFT_336798 [Phytophthora sojae]|eukprot:XP_009532706.1 hypothetical protein PHYSODRAFT_336798 [Phytophthora sojae]
MTRQSARTSAPASPGVTTRSSGTPVTDAALPERKRRRVEEHTRVVVDDGQGGEEDVEWFKSTAESDGFESLDGFKSPADGSQYTGFESLPSNNGFKSLSGFKSLTQSSGSSPDFGGRVVRLGYRLSARTSAPASPGVTTRSSGTPVTDAALPERKRRRVEEHTRVVVDDGQGGEEDVEWFKSTAESDGFESLDGFKSPADGSQYTGFESLPSNNGFKSLRGSESLPSNNGFKSLRGSESLQSSDGFKSLSGFKSLTQSSGSSPDFGGRVVRLGYRLSARTSAPASPGVTTRSSGTPVTDAALPERKRRRVEEHTRVVVDDGQGGEEDVEWFKSTAESDGFESLDGFKSPADGSQYTGFESLPSNNGFKSLRGSESLQSSDGFKSLSGFKSLTQSSGSSPDFGGRVVRLGYRLSARTSAPASPGVTTRSSGTPVTDAALPERKRRRVEEHTRVVVDDGQGGEEDVEWFKSTAESDGFESLDGFKSPADGSQYTGFESLPSNNGFKSLSGFKSLTQSSGSSPDFGGRVVRLGYRLSARTSAPASPGVTTRSSGTPVTDAALPERKRRRVEEHTRVVVDDGQGGEEDVEWFKSTAESDGFESLDGFKSPADGSQYTGFESLPSNNGFKSLRGSESLPSNNGFKSLRGSESLQSSDGFKSLSGFKSLTQSSGSSPDFGGRVVRLGYRLSARTSAPASPGVTTRSSGTPVTDAALPERKRRRVEEHTRVVVDDGQGGEEDVEWFKSTAESDGFESLDGFKSPADGSQYTGFESLPSNNGFKSLRGSESLQSSDGFKSLSGFKSLTQSSGSSPDFGGRVVRLGYRLSARTSAPASPGVTTRSSGTPVTDAALPERKRRRVEEHTRVVVDDGQGGEEDVEWFKSTAESDGFESLDGFKSPADGSQYTGFESLPSNNGFKSLRGSESLQSSDGFKSLSGFKSLTQSSGSSPDFGGRVVRLGYRLSARTSAPASPGVTTRSSGTPVTDAALPERKRRRVEEHTRVVVDDGQGGEEDVEWFKSTAESDGFESLDGFKSPADGSQYTGFESLPSNNGFKSLSGFKSLTQSSGSSPDFGGRVVRLGYRLSARTSAPASPGVTTRSSGTPVTDAALPERKRRRVEEHTRVVVDDGQGGEEDVEWFKSTAESDGFESLDGFKSPADGSQYTGFESLPSNNGFKSLSGFKSLTQSSGSSPDFGGRVVRLGYRLSARTSAPASPGVTTRSSGTPVTDAALPERKRRRVEEHTRVVVDDGQGGEEDVEWFKSTAESDGFESLDGFKSPADGSQYTGFESLPSNNGFKSLRGSESLPSNNGFKSLRGFKSLTQSSGSSPDFGGRVVRLGYRLSARTSAPASPGVTTRSSGTPVTDAALPERKRRRVEEHTRVVVDDGQGGEEDVEWFKSTAESDGFESLDGFKSPADGSQYTGFESLPSNNGFKSLRGSESLQSSDGFKSLSGFKSLTQSSGSSPDFGGRVVRLGYRLSARTSAPASPGVTTRSSGTPVTDAALPERKRRRVEEHTRVVVDDGQGGEEDVEWFKSTAESDGFESLDGFKSPADGSQYTGFESLPSNNGFKSLRGSESLQSSDGFKSLSGFKSLTQSSGSSPDFGGRVVRLGYRLSARTSAPASPGVTTRSSGTPVTDAALPERKRRRVEEHTRVVVDDGQGGEEDVEVSTSVITADEGYQRLRRTPTSGSSPQLRVTGSSPWTGSSPRLTAVGQVDGFESPESNRFQPQGTTAGSSP